MKNLVRDYIMIETKETYQTFPTPDPAFSVAFRGAVQFLTTPFALFFSSSAE